MLEQQAGTSPPQTVPHVPQFITLFGTQRPMQQSSLAAQGRMASHMVPASGSALMHMPAMHISPVAQTLPHSPQLLSSPLVSTH
jgi:hypothetical protein